MLIIFKELTKQFEQSLLDSLEKNDKKGEFEILRKNLITQSSKEEFGCLLYTSPSPRDMRRSRMPSSA